MPPPPVGLPEDLEGLRTLVAATGYTGERICERLGLTDIHEFQHKQPKILSDPDAIESALDVMMRLFIASLDVDEEVARRLLPPGSLDLLRRTGLLQETGCRPAAMLYPVEGVYLASDRAMWNNAPAGADLVFAAMTSHTGEYLSVLPPEPCDAFLELCGGTGVAALIAARHGAKRAWSCDITERSTRFAEFNARLNQLANVTALQGDLYDPVAGLTFDRIAAHPPYIPATKTNYVFRDGGEDGEQIVRRVISGVPAFLRPGGRFYMTGLINERDGLKAEERVRRMLGENHAEFDVAVAFLQSMLPKDFGLREQLKGRATPEEAEQHQKSLKELGIERLIYCWVIVQRHASKRAPFTTRRNAGDLIGWREMEWVIQSESLWADASQYERMLDAPVVLAQNLESWVTERFSDGAWSAVSCTLRTTSPFRVQISGPPWLSDMVRMCNGRATVRQILDQMIERKLVEGAPKGAEFLRFLRPFGTAGVFFLDADGFPLYREKLQ